jgi:hypothetical protein
MYDANEPLADILTQLLRDISYEEVRLLGKWNTLGSASR